MHFEFAIKTDGGGFGGPDNKFQYWIGLFSASPDGIEFPPLGLQMAAFRFRPASAAIWQVFGSNDSGFTEGSGSSIAVLPNTEYLLEIKLLSTTAEFWIDGVLYHTLDASQGDRLPEPSQLLGYGVRVFAFDANAEDRTVRWKRISWDHV